MTNTVINSFVKVTDSDAFDIDGNGDILLVTSAGALVSEGYGAGIYASGNAQTIALDGLVYSASDSATALSRWVRVILRPIRAQSTAA
jgi:hypothetical protein